MRPSLTIPALLFALSACDPEHAPTPSSPDGQGGKADDADDAVTSTSPIVLVHAFHATASNSWSLERVAEVLEEEGHFVVLADLPPYAGTPERAEVLVDALDDARAAFCEATRADDDRDACFDETKVHIVGHSQGGLDARYAVSRLGYGPHTLSVTTLSTPHRGTPLGDLGLSLLKDPRRDREASSLLKAALDALLTRLLDGIRPQGLADAFYWLSEARFEAGLVEGSDEAMPDVEGVHYQSWAGVATSDGELPDVEACEDREHFPKGRAAELRGFHDTKIFTVIAGVFDEPAHEPNDGHIPVVSARFGDFLGCVPTDHLDLIGRPGDQADENAELAGFDYRSFYRDLGRSLDAIEADP